MPVTLVDIEAQVLELAHDANQLQRSFVNELSNATQELRASSRVLPWPPSHPLASSQRRLPAGRDSES